MAASTPDTPVGSHLVFISHRGVRMKLGFASCLYYALKSTGIDAFLDMEELPIGSDARKNMLEAVGRASIQVPIFTEDFGTSNWCLEELAIMMDSKRDRGAKVIPVYFNLEPEELRNENGPFGKHLKAFLQNCPSGDEIIRRWKNSLEEASWLEGFRLKTYGGAEGKLIEALVKKIDVKIVDRLCVDMVREPVGLDVKVQEVVERLCLQEETRVHVVLVWGMGGVGKTTLAEAIYRQYRKDFEEASFVLNCGGLPVIQIQGRLLKDLLRCNSNMAEDVSLRRSRLRDGLNQKKAFIILDDVNSFSLLEDAVNVKQLCPGSRILLTSRNKIAFPQEEDFSAVFGGDRYELQTMGDRESLQLLCLHAFRRPHPNPGFENVAKEVAKACGGLPLSLEVLGGHLRTLKEEKLWREAIEKLLDNKYKGISGRLMISYEALDDDEQQMFQDVACFLIGRLERRAKSFWHVSVKGYETGLLKLQYLCLVKVDESKRLTMHDHLRDLGRDISRKNKTRVWNDEDLQQLLTEKQGLNEIRGVATSRSFLEASDIAKMKSLQLLFLNGTELRGTCKGPNIRWLKWKECPHKTLPKDLFTEFLAVLQLEFQEGHVSRFPSVDTQLTKLQELEVTRVKSSSAPRFEKLKRYLEMTTGWHSELQGFGALESLQVLRLNLERITKLPFPLSQSKSLREVDISRCLRLEGLPEDFGALKCLEVFLADNLNLITKLPSSFGQLKRLRYLDISWCEQLKGLPEDLGSLECLEVLYACRLILITKLPPSFGQLKRLCVLHIAGCNRLEGLPEDFGSVECLETLFASNLELITKLPPSFGQLKRLRNLDISRCNRLEGLPEDLGSLECLEVLLACDLKLITKLPSSFAQLKRLRELDISGCERLERLPEDLGALECLEVLLACNLKVITKLPSSFVQLKRLRKLDISLCERLEGLPEDFGSLECLEVLLACDLKLITKLPPFFGQLKRLNELNISGCERLEELPEDFGSLERLKVFWARNLKSINKLPPSFRPLKERLWGNRSLFGLHIAGSERLEELIEDLGS